MKINKYSLVLICIYNLNAVWTYGQKSTDNLTNFNYLKNKPAIETIVFEKDQRQGHGILKYGYVFQVQSHSNQEEYGVKIIAMTTFAKLSSEDKAKTKDYIIYIEKEILKIADVFIKNKDIYDKIKKSIALKKGVFNTKLNTYYLPVEDDGKDDIIEEVDVLVNHFDFYSDIITINMRYVN